MNISRGGVLLLGFALLAVRDDPERRLLDQVARHGMPAPRPVDPGRRADLGFPPPRDSATILAERREVTATMDEITARDEVWKERFAEYYALQRRRIDLASEWEEAGGRGADLAELLSTKLADIDAAERFVGRTFAGFDGLRTDIRRRHPDRDEAALAHAAQTMALIQTVKRQGYRIHPDDYPKLAAVEAARHDEEAGACLLEALHGETDPVLLETWQDWMLDHLDPGSVGYRATMRQRMFGAPIRLQGEALDGGTLDTADWLGDVILVDFWGMWCVPCRAAMPDLKEMLDRHGDRGLRVVGVLCDHELDAAARWLDERGFDWPQFVDRSLTPRNKTEHPIARRFAVGGFPTLWLIDRAGVLREEVDRDDLEAVIRRYLDEGR